MIYIKIYLDKDENCEDMLVFDSAKEDSEYDYFTVAGEKKMGRFFSDDDYTFFEGKTKVIGVELVAISPEAKEFFLSLLKDESTHEEMPYGHSGDFAMDSGKFAYCPPEIKNGDTRKILRRTDRFTVECVFSQIPLDYMTPCLNETLKSLDLPADETPLLDAYYTEMRATGEELGCDVDTIRKTPLRYLTEAQREVIRAEYRGLASRYDKQEWNESRDYDHAAMLEAKISEVIIKKYGKVIGD